ncbi:hypothetical protein B296_00036868 [Ensete ventricosum]|uniref:Uncharacterized protein n=1 Tax=Ensete ventricosum TaxID=4639 RepID=A0A427A143_ENSVE|nr:hypothetical protein B296_00036868 [Ensete ventricosum]
MEVIDGNAGDYLLGEVQRIRMMAPGNRTWFRKGRIASRLGSSTDSAIAREEREGGREGEGGGQRLGVGSNGSGSRLRARYIKNPTSHRGPQHPYSSRHLSHPITSITWRMTTSSLASERGGSRSVPCTPATLRLDHLSLSRQEHRTSSLSHKLSGPPTSSSPATHKSHCETSACSLASLERAIIRRRDAELYAYVFPDSHDEGTHD